MTDLPVGQMSRVAPIQTVPLQQNLSKSSFSHRFQVSLKAGCFLQGLVERTNKILNKLLTSRVMGIKLSDLFSGLVCVTVRLKAHFPQKEKEKTADNGCVLSACRRFTLWLFRDCSILTCRTETERGEEKGVRTCVSVYVCVTERERGLRGELDWDNIIFSASPGNCASFCSI